MRQGRVHGDDEIEIHHCRGGVSQVRADVVGQVRPLSQLFAAWARLQAEQFHAGKRGQRSEMAQRDRTPAIAGVARDCLASRCPPNREKGRGESGRRGDSLPPAFDQNRVGMNIRNIGRNGCNRMSCPASRGRLRSSVHVETWQGIADNDPIQAIAARQQRCQSRRAQENRRAARLLDLPGVADELDRIADALLGVQKNRPAMKRRAVPERLRQLRHRKLTERQRHSNSAHP